jgi:hypothetical protein
MPQASKYAEYTELQSAEIDAEKINRRTQTSSEVATPFIICHPFPCLLRIP